MLLGQYTKGWVRPVVVRASGVRQHALMASRLDANTACRMAIPSRSSPEYFDVDLAACWYNYGLNIFHCFVYMTFFSRQWSPTGTLIIPYPLLVLLQYPASRYRPAGNPSGRP